MKNDKDDKPVTLNQLGITLEKFITPIYTRLDRLEGDVTELKKDVGEIKIDLNEVKVVQVKQGEDINKLKTDVGTLKSDFDTMSSIQLRMENKLGDNIQALYDKGSSHDDKLEDHNKRITKLEKTI